MPIFTLSGVVFFDYNGNGVQDSEEPPIEGAKVQIGYDATVSGPDGTYALEGVPKGKKAVQVAAEGFRFLSLSSAAFQSIGFPAWLTIGGDTRRDWGLMRGFLTLPFSRQVTVQGMRYVDLNAEEPSSIDWRGLGDREQYFQECYPTLDRHLGTDIYTGLGNPVLAAAPGTVFRIGGYEPADGNLVGLFHPVSGPRNGYTTVYAHLGSVSVSQGQVVSRGDQVGTSGRTGTFRDCDPGHMHFQLNRSPTGAFEGRSHVVCPFNEQYWTGGTEAHPPY